MKLRRLICFVLFLFLVQTNGTGEELVFTGSFWDTADSFRLTINFKKTPARLEWDGYPENDYDRKKGAPGRTTFGFDLTEEETSLLQSLKKGLPLCHSGHQAVIGTGLSNSVRIWHEGKLKGEQGYFHIEPTAILGQRMSEIPINFQEKTVKGSLSENERSGWIEEVRELVIVLEAWQEALDILGNAQKNNSTPPWAKLLAISQETKAPETIESFEGQLAFAYEAEPVVDLLISQQNRSKYFPELGTGHIIVRIDEIFKDEIDEWHSILPPHDLGAESEQWTQAPSAFLLLLGDYLGVTGKFGEVNHHGLLDHINPHDAQKDEFLKRLEFIDSSNWATPLLKKGQEVQPNNEFRILRLTFEEEMSKCVVLTHRDDEALLTFLRVKDGVWKILRQIDYDNWKVDPFK